MLPTMTPTMISISATEMPRRIETRLATRANPIQNAAINQMFSISNSVQILGASATSEPAR